MEVSKWAELFVIMWNFLMWKGYEATLIGWEKQINNLGAVHFENGPHIWIELWTARFDGTVDAVLVGTPCVLLLFYLYSESTGDDIRCHLCMVVSLKTQLLSFSMWFDVTSKNFAHLRSSRKVNSNIIGLFDNSTDFYGVFSIIVHQFSIFFLCDWSNFKSIWLEGQKENDGHTRG